MKHLGLQKVLTRLAIFCVLALVGHSVSAHTWEVRVAQNSPTTLTFYLQSYHSASGCSTAGLSLNVNGTNYPASAAIPGGVPLATTSPYADRGSCGSRAGYATVTVPYFGGPISVGSINSPNQCWTSQVNTINPAYVYVPNLNAPLPPNTGPCSSTPCSGAIVYAVSGAGGSASNLYEVCLSTGGTTLIGSTGYSGLRGLAQNPVDGKWYGWSHASGLIEINISTGAGTLIGTNTGSTNYADMTIDQNGVCYLYGGCSYGRVDIVDLSNGFISPSPLSSVGCRVGMEAVGNTMYYKSYSTLYSQPLSGGPVTNLGFMGWNAAQNQLTYDPNSGRLITGNRLGSSNLGVYPRCEPGVSIGASNALYSFDLNGQNGIQEASACLGQFSAIAFGSNVTTAAAPIPTVSEWGLIFLFLGFLSVGSAWMFRRQRNEAIA